MHFEILVEDQSGKSLLEMIIPKIVGNSHTFRVIAYKGIGHIPRDLNNAPDPSNKNLLAHLPQMIRAYGKTFASYSGENRAVVVIVCDLDGRCQKDFRREVLEVIDSSLPKPKACVCFAIEESEAWLLGDRDAILAAYPSAKLKTLETYVQDDICGTWECLADAIFPGEERNLTRRAIPRSEQKSPLGQKPLAHT